MPTYPQAPKELTQEALDKFADTSAAARRAYNELMDAVGYGASWDEMEEAAKGLSPQSRNIINAIIREDALGFDDPAQALRQIASNPEETLRFYEMNPQMKGALTKATNQGFDLGKAGKALGLFAAPVLFMNAQDTYAKGIEAGDSPAKAATRAAVEFGVDAVSPLGLTATEVGAGSDVVPNKDYYAQDSMPNYEDFLQFEAQRRGWDDQGVANFEGWRNAVGQVESRNIPTRTQGDSAQGIGRGKYQYELKPAAKDSKASGANLTAVNRLKAFLPRYGYSIDDLPPADKKELSSSNPDFSKLSENTQDIIFLADKSEASDTRLNDLASGKVSARDAWLDWHWKGDPKERQSQAAKWERNSQYTQPTSAYDWSFNNTTEEFVPVDKETSWMDQFGSSLRDLFR